MRGFGEEGAALVDVEILRTTVPFCVVLLADHPNTYHRAGLRWRTTTSSSTRHGTTLGNLSVRLS